MATTNQQAYTLWADFWQALSHPIRLRVLAALRQTGPMNVGELVSQLKIGQGHLSNHLACLKNCGLVTTESQGRFVYYRIADDRVPALLDMGEAIFSDHWAGVANCAVVNNERSVEVGEVASVRWK
jgi:ArsR family transcriptional regulator